MVRQAVKAMCLSVGIAAATLAAASIASAAEGTADAPVRPTVDIQREVERRAVELTTDTAIALASGVPFTELSIANPQIADISTISMNSLYLLGKRPGRTTLMLMGEGGEVISIIDVNVTPDISEFKARLAEILPGEQIEAFTANDGIVLTGRVGSQSQIDRALALAGHYAPGRISNLMTVEAPVAAAPALPAPQAVLPDAGAVQKQIAEILPLEDIRVHVLGETLVLSGEASSPEAAQQALEVAKLVAAGARVSNLITVAVMADCKVRTRRGGEMIETTIPCRQQASAVPESPPAAVSAQVEPEVATLVAGMQDLPRPRPRPSGRAVN